MTDPAPTGGGRTGAGPDAVVVGARQPQAVEGQAGSSHSATRRASPPVAITGAVLTDLHPQQPFDLR